MQSSIGTRSFKLPGAFIHDDSDHSDEPFDKIHFIRDYVGDVRKLYFSPGDVDLNNPFFGPFRGRLQRFNAANTDDGEEESSEDFGAEDGGAEDGGTKGSGAGDEQSAADADAEERKRIRQDRLQLLRWLKRDLLKRESRTLSVSSSASASASSSAVLRRFIVVDPGANDAVDASGASYMAGEDEEDEEDEEEEDDDDDDDDSEEERADRMERLVKRLTMARCGWHFANSSRVGERKAKKNGVAGANPGFHNNAIYECAQASHRAAFKAALRKLSKMCPHLAKKLSAKHTPSETWAQYALLEKGVSCYGHITSNLVEGFNAVIKASRALHPLLFIDDMITKMNRYYAEHLSEALEWEAEGFTLTPWAQEKKEEEAQQARNSLYFVKDAGGVENVSVEHRSSKHSILHSVSMDVNKPKCDKCP
jgi:hypothetical protein